MVEGREWRVWIWVRTSWFVRVADWDSRICEVGRLSGGFIEEDGTRSRTVPVPSSCIGLAGKCGV